MLLSFLLQITQNGAETAETTGEVVPQEKTLSIIELLTSGGIGGQIIMLTLLIFSVIAIYIFVERLSAVNKAAKIDENFMNNIKDHVLSGKIDAAKSLCQSTNSPVSRMIEKGISRIGKPLGDVSAAIENSGKLEVYKLENNLSTLATISGAAPMIGFLGTVIGMILTFHEMTLAGGQVNLDMLSEGIFTAMTTTVAGLTVGIVAYIAYNMLVSKVSKVIYKMEATATEFIDVLHEPA